MLIIGGPDGPDGPDEQVALNVPRDSSAADVKKAYRKQALVWHPDKNESSCMYYYNKYRSATWNNVVTIYPHTPIIEYSVRAVLIYFNSWLQDLH